MPSTVPAWSRRVRVAPLNPADFAPFGEVAQNPDTHHGQPAIETVKANQGTATKWLDVSHMESFYDRGPSKQKAKCVMNMFVCEPRELANGRLFKVGILERHPYTPQTFVPMGLDKDDKETAYLVIVAPTLGFDQWPEEAYNKMVTLEDYQERIALIERHNRARLQATASGTTVPPTAGPPDLSNLRAFIARGDQAVTYGPDTWHAPMVVLGARAIEFLVVQYANGVALDDCEEVEFRVQDGGNGLEVDVGSSEGKGIAEVKSKM